MEAMGVETLLLSIWEEEGFVGKTRVPVGSSDVDVLAVRPRDRAVRVGEAKVREGCTLVYPVDQEHLAEMASPGNGFDWWLSSDEWCSWLRNLPLLWEQSGAPAVPWLPAVSDLSTIEVTFLCNLWVFGAGQLADGAMERTASMYLRQNQNIASAIDSGRLRVSGRVLPTGVAAQRLVRTVALRINEDGYTRRFGDPLKDTLRELNRYLHPFVKKIPRDASGTRTDTRREASQAEIRKETLRGLLEALGVGQAELEELARS